MTADTRTASTSGVERQPWYELGMMADPILDNVLLYYLGSVRQGLADVGEVLDTAGRVDPADEWSWPREWFRTAARLSAQADASETRGHALSAGSAALRAATYYRAGLHRFPEPTDPTMREMAARTVAEFERGIRLSRLPAESVLIPYEGTTLPGYFFRAPDAKAPAPLLVVQQGRDAWAADCKYLAEAANARGYHCLAFDGPGQGRTLRLQGLPFRPDWENIVGPVLDYALARPEVDPTRVALIGLSFGGALVPRAAAFERRLKIAIANPGVYRWHEIIDAFFAQIDPSLPDLAESDPAAFDARIAAISDASPLVRWGVKDTLWKHGARTPHELLAAMNDYTNEGLAERIACETLVMDGTADAWSQGRALYEALRCPKSYLLFSEADTGLVHCQTGALAVSTERTFDWLDERL